MDIIVTRGKYVRDACLRVAFWAYMDSRVIVPASDEEVFHAVVFRHTFDTIAPLQSHCHSQSGCNLGILLTRLPSCIPVRSSISLVSRYSPSRTFDTIAFLSNRTV